MENYQFDGTEGDIIPINNAQLYIQNYQAGPCLTWNQGIKAHFYGKDILLELLNQSGAMGLRFYYGSKPSASGGALQPELVIVAADSNGDDILVNNKIADVSRPCPIFCPINSGL